MSHDEIVKEAVAGAGGHASAIDYAKLVVALDRHIEGLGRATDGIEIDVTWLYHAMMLLAGLGCLWLAYCVRLGTGGRVAGVGKRNGDREDGQETVVNVASTPHGLSNTEHSGGTTNPQVSSTPRPNDLQTAIPSFAEYISAAATPPPPPPRDSPSISDIGKSAPNLDDSAADDWHAFKDRGEREKLQRMFREAARELDDFVWGLCVGDNRDGRLLGRLWNRHRMSKARELGRGCGGAMEGGGLKGGCEMFSAARITVQGVSDSLAIAGVHSMESHYVDQKKGEEKPTWYPELAAKQPRTAEEEEELRCLRILTQPLCKLEARRRHGVQASALHKRRTGRGLGVTGKELDCHEIWEENEEDAERVKEAPTPCTTVKKEEEAPVKSSTAMKDVPNWYAELMARSDRSVDETMEVLAIMCSRSMHLGLERRMQHAVKASDLHKKRTGHSLVITEEAVLSNRVYEEDVSTRTFLSFASPTCSPVPQ